MVQVTQAVKRGTLAELGVQQKVSRERLKNDVLRPQVFAASVSIPVTAMPVITNRIPPHKAWAIQMVSGEEAPI